MYAAFYGLRELPFELTPNPQYLYLTPRHREVLSNLEYGISARRGITVLIGEAGTGKTTLVHAALGLVRRDDARCIYLNNPTLTRNEFVEYLASGFGLSEAARRSKAAFLIELERVLLERQKAGIVSALLIDEAQSMPHDLLEETRLLANMETTTEKLLPVVLAGQPELADRLNEPSLRQLKQRVALRCDLAALQLHETAAYISARLERAGGIAARIFTRDAVITIHERSGGIPRTISVLCDNALINGFAVDRKPVDRDLVIEVCRDLDFARQGDVVPSVPKPAVREMPPEPPGPRPDAQPEPGEVPMAASPPPEQPPSLFSAIGKRRRFIFF